MPPKRARARILRGALVISVALTVLILCALVPPLLIPDAQEVWTESEALAAYYARNQVQSAGDPLQRLLNLKVSVRDVQADPSAATGAMGGQFQES